MKKRETLMKPLLLFGLACMLVLSFVFTVHASTSGGLTIDGDSTDWVAEGLSAVGTDPPYNEPHSYNPICTDLLEAWACKNETHLFLMMKIRGGTPDFDDAFYVVSMNIDPNGNTGELSGDDYYVSCLYNSGYFARWNQTTLSWNSISNSNVSSKAGGLGYIEWSIPLSEVGGNVSNLKLYFYTYDRTYDDLVNSITVTLSPPTTIPEFPSLATLMIAVATASLVPIILVAKRKG